MPKVSVIIPTYNRSKYVTKAIDSVLAQTYKDNEIIVIDDGSTDDTRNVLAPYMDHISYFYQENAGVSVARNNGIKIARGEWIAFLDSDDEWFNDKLSVQMNFIARYPFVVAHSVNIDLSDYESPGQTSFSHCRFLPTSYEQIIENPFRHHLQYSTTMMPSGIICKKKAAIKVGLFDESLSISEDYDFMCRLALQGNWGCSNNVLVVMHKRKEITQRLSAARRTSQIYACMSLIKAHSKLLSEQCLKNSDRKVVSKLLSSNYRTLGQLLSKRGSYKESREAFGKAYDIHLSFKSFLWYTFSRLPGNVIEKVVNFRSL